MPCFSIYLKLKKFLRKIRTTLHIIWKFSKAFDSIHRGKMEQIQHAYGLLKETVAGMMILYKNLKAMAGSLNGDMNFFEIVAGVLKGDTLASYLSIMCLDYILQMSIDLLKENGFTVKKTKSRWYPTETMTYRLCRWSSKYTCLSWIPTA